MAYLRGVPCAASNMRPITLQQGGIFCLLKLNCLQRHMCMTSNVHSAIVCNVAIAHAYSQRQLLPPVRLQPVLTAYELLDDKLKTRSSTLKARVLLFRTSFDDRKPSNPCRCCKWLSCNAALCMLKQKRQMFRIMSPMNERLSPC